MFRMSEGKKEEETKGKVLYEQIEEDDEFEEFETEDWEVNEVEAEEEDKVWQDDWDDHDKLDDNFISMLRQEIQKAKAV